MKNIRKISYAIIGIFLLMLWSSIVRNITLGQRSMGPLTEPIKSFSEVTSNIKKAYKYYLEAPDYYLKTRNLDKEEINNLNYNLYGLYSFRNGNKFSIDLKNFRDGKIVYNWNIKVNDLSQYYNVGQNDRLFPAKLISDREVIVSCDERPGMLKIDSLSNVIWFNSDYIFHHGMNFDHEKNIWTPGVKHKNGLIIPNNLMINGKKVEYRDDIVLKIDSKTGKTLYYKSLTEIFQENNIEGLINKASNSTDPFHLNDVEPVLIENSPYFDKGDIFLSFRHLSSVIQFRPSTNKVIRVIEGPFSFQHDVDIISENSIAILNNNTITRNNVNKFDFNPVNQSIQRKITHSNVLIHNFETNTYKSIYENAFVDNEIYTAAEGLYELLDNGDLFFEEQGSGILWVLNKDGVVLKTTYKSDIEGYHFLPNWTSVYTNINY